MQIFMTRSQMSGGFEPRFFCVLEGPIDGSLDQRSEQRFAMPPVTVNELEEAQVELLLLST
jgi:hypothetical protein